MPAFLMYYLNEDSKPVIINSRDITVENNTLEYDLKKDLQHSKESEPVKTIRSFYTCLSTGQYSKAYNLLDDKFTVNIFKQFGIDELSKAEININDFSQYGVFFQTAKIKNIVAENTSADTSTIYFNQMITLEQGDQIQPLVVTLKKTASSWKIAAVADGKPSGVPFKSSGE